MVTETIQQTAESLLACVSDALEADLRPVCKVYKAVGVPVIETCCGCSDGANGELSIHFRRLFDADPITLNEIQRVRPCRTGVIAAQFRLVLARCMPVIDEYGAVPDSADLDEAAADQLTDANLMWSSLACCPDFQLRIDDLSVDLGPMGGCSIIYADVTVAVRVPPSAP